MQVECTGRQVTITKSLRALAEEGISRIALILGKTTSAHVVLTAEKYRQMAEVTLKTRLQTIVGSSEATVMETALRDAIMKAETQAVRYKARVRTRKRQPKEDKAGIEVELARTRTSKAASAKPVDAMTVKSAQAIGNGRSKPVLPVTVHSFPAKQPISEPHVVRSSDSVALRPMTLEEAVKEAEFRDREVFVFRDREGNVKVLHRKRDGKMELIEAP
jgi:putative sigma-54 modulation protein